MSSQAFRMAYKTEPVEVENLKPEDIIIAVMGLTGSGKSQVIDSLTGQKTRAGSNLESYTQEVSADRVLGHEKYANKLVLVDTPGFEDTNKDNENTLKMISQWMTKIHERGITLAGIIYTHSITANRLNDGEVQSLSMFRRLCGGEYAKKVVFLTTRWDEVTDEKEADGAEKDLEKNYYKGLITQGATMGRFYIDDPKSQWAVVDTITQRLQDPLLQEEMVHCRHYTTQTLKAGGLEAGDIVIAFMGPTGSGKSQVIDTLTGQKRRAGATLKSVTCEVSAHRVLGHRKYGNKLVLVDTPGFDDIIKPSDMEILDMVSRWMKKSGVTLTSIFYTHRITDLRTSGTPHHNLPMFRDLCGDQSARNVMLLTTMWDKKADKSEEVEKREEDLKARYWKPMIDRGATVGRFHMNELSGPKSPWSIVDRVIQQRQMDEDREILKGIGKRLDETKALFRDLQELLDKHGKTIKLLEEQVELEGGRTGVDVEAEIVAFRADIENIMKQFESLKISLPGKVANFFWNLFGQTEQMVSAEPSVISA